jgi:hypothetical protein
LGAVGTRRGDSEYLPQAGASSGVQALCCLSGALVVRPGDEPPREFRVRPDDVLDKGTGAQHRQVLKPLRVSTAPKGVLITGFYSIISLTPKQR